MSSLPEELYFEIVPHSTVRTLLVLCLCSRAWYIAASNALYRDIHQFGTDRLSTSTRLLQTIISNEHIGRLVQHLTVSCVFEDAKRLLSGALRNMPNLRCLRYHHLGDVAKRDKTCADALAGLKHLDSLLCGLFRNDVVFRRLASLRHIQITGNPGLVTLPPALEDLIIRSHKEITYLELSAHQLTRIMDGIPNSAVFARLQTIALDDHAFPLSLLLRHQFPALKIIKANRSEQKHLLHDPAFLPSLQAMHFACIPDSSYEMSLIDGSATPARSGRQLHHLDLNMGDMFTQLDADSVDKFCSFIKPFSLGHVSSLTLVATYSKQGLNALSALRRHLTQSNSLRVICLQLLADEESVESVSELFPSVEIEPDAVSQSMGYLKEIAEDDLLSNIAYLRLETRYVAEEVKTQFGSILRRTSIRAGDYRAVARERGSMFEMRYTSWTRAGEGDGWSSWSALSDEQDKLPWPDYLLSLDDMDLLAALRLRE